MSSTTVSDEGLLNQFFDTIAANRRAFAVMLGAAVVVGGIAVAFSFRNDEKASAAANSLFLAQKTLSREMKAVAQAKAPAAPQATVKGANPKAPAPAPEVNEESVRFERLDVDQKFPESVKALRSIMEGEFKGTRSAYEARLILGNLYFDHGDPAKAVSEFDAAVKMAPMAHEKAMAWMSLGRAQENSGKLPEAASSYTQAQGSADSDVIRAESLLAQARVQELLKDSAKAKAAYDQVVKLMPGTDYARTAETQKARLE